MEEVVIWRVLLIGVETEFNSFQLAIEGYAIRGLTEIRWS